MRKLASTLLVTFLLTSILGIPKKAEAIVATPVVTGVCLTGLYVAMISTGAAFDIFGLINLHDTE